MHFYSISCLVSTTFKHIHTDKHTTTLTSPVFLPSTSAESQLLKGHRDRAGRGELLVPVTVGGSHEGIKERSKARLAGRDVFY